MTILVFPVVGDVIGWLANMSMWTDAQQHILRVQWGRPNRGSVR